MPVCPRAIVALVALHVCPVSWKMLAIPYQSAIVKTACKLLHTTDINECAGNSTCDDNADCVDSDGSYWCQCLPGFQGDGYNCTGQSPAKQLHRAALVFELVQNIYSHHT